MKLTKLGKWTAGILGASLMLSFGVIQYDKHLEREAKAEAKVEEKSTPVVKIEKREKLEVSSLIADYDMLSDEELEREMHGMTHQKVEADQKWINVEMTPEKVTALMAVVEDRAFEDPALKELMLRILNKWIKGDFSQIVTDHNALWTYEGGDVGEASRAYTEEEEKEFIANNY